LNKKNADGIGPRFWVNFKRSTCPLREGTVKILQSRNDIGRYPGLFDFCRLLIHYIWWTMA